jgi:hypothetical protein
VTAGARPVEATRQAIRPSRADAAATAAREKAPRGERRHLPQNRYPPCDPNVTTTIALASYSREGQTGVGKRDWGSVPAQRGCAPGLTLWPLRLKATALAAVGMLTP